MTNVYKALWRRDDGSEGLPIFLLARSVEDALERAEYIAREIHGHGDSSVYMLFNGKGDDPVWRRYNLNTFDL